MKSFRFPLERALRWRHLQFEAEEAKLRGLLEEQGRLEQQIRICRSEKLRTTIGLGQENNLLGKDLRALAAFQTRATIEETKLLGQLQRKQQELLAQGRIFREAKQRCRILEELRTRELKKWQYELGCEIEQIAADSYAAKYSNEDESRG